MIQLKDGNIATTSEAVFSTSEEVGVIDLLEPGVARIWDADSGKTITEHAQHNGNVEEIAELENGNMVTRSSSSVHVWNPKTGETITTRSGVRDTLIPLADGNIVSITTAGNAHVWDPNSGETITQHELEPDKGTGSITQLDDDTFAIIDYSGTAYVWDSGTGETLIASPLDLEDALYQPVLLDNGNLAVIHGKKPEFFDAGEVNVVQGVLIWDPGTGKTINKHTVEHDGTRVGRQSMIGLEGSNIATLAGDESSAALLIWDSATGETIAEQPIDNTNSVVDIIRLEDGKIAAIENATLQQLVVHILDPDTGETLDTHIIDDASFARAALLLDDGRIAISQVRDKIHILNL